MRCLWREKHFTPRAAGGKTFPIGGDSFKKLALIGAGLCPLIGDHRN